MTSRGAGKGAPEDKSTSKPREPYVGVAESLIVKVLVDPASPRAEQYRRTIHRLSVCGAIFFAAGLLALIVIMLVAVVSN